LGFTLAAAYLVKQYKPALAVGVMAALVVFCLYAYRPNTVPETTLSWEFVVNQYLLAPAPQLTMLSTYAAKVNDGTFEESNLRLGLLTTVIPGTRSAMADETLEYVTLDPSTVLPLHKHSARNYALALTSGLEYTTNRGVTWKTWKRGQIINIPKSVEHSVRNVSSGEAKLVSTSEGPRSALNDFLN
jgi:quercetin dioxygenase-like cupin family protein